MALKSVVLPAPLPDDGDEFVLMDPQVDAFQRLRLAVEYIDALDIQQSGALRCAGPALDRLDGAAEIHPAHRLVLHHFVGATLGDALAEIHGDDAIGESRDALDAVIDQQHGAAVVA